MKTALAKQLYNYNPATGELTHAHNKGSVKAGQRVGYTTKKEQVTTTYKKKQFMVSHICWSIFHGLEVPSGSIIDHKNGDPTDNRIDNLRLTNHTGNNRNSRIPSHNTTGVKGLTTARNKRTKEITGYRAMIKVNGKQIYLGTFKCKDEGRKALEAAREKYHGEYANNG